MKLRVETAQTIGRPRDEVLEAWVDPGKMSGYFISNGSARLTAGETVVWTWDDHGGARLEIDVESVEPNRLVFHWEASGARSRVEVELEARGEAATRVRVRDGDWEADEVGIRRYGEQMQGWVHMLCCLKAYLEYEAANLRDTVGGSHGCRVESLLEASPADLFRALTREWGTWFGVGPIEMRPSAGAAFWFDARDEREELYPHYGRFLRLAPDREVEMTWMTGATRGIETRLRIELTPEGDGTRVRLAHTGFLDRAAMARHEAAWPHVLEHLDRYLG